MGIIRFAPERIRSPSSSPGLFQARWDSGVRLPQDSTPPLLDPEEAALSRRLQIASLTIYRPPLAPVSVLALTEYRIHGSLSLARLWEGHPHMFRS